MENPADIYLDYLRQRCPNLPESVRSRVVERLNATRWDDPESSSDRNNIAVVTWIEAERSEDLFLRRAYVDMAAEVLQQSVQTWNSPLCAAHLALGNAIVGDRSDERILPFPTFLNLLQAAREAEKLPAGLIYLPSPSYWHFSGGKLRQHPFQNELANLLAIDNEYVQATHLLAFILSYTQLAFYSQPGKRMLHLAMQFFPNSPDLNLQLGIAHIVGGQWEGLAYLHRAERLAPYRDDVRRALSLAYQDFERPREAKFWQASDRKTPSTSEERFPNDSPTVNSEHAESPEEETGIIFLPFEEDTLLAVENSLRSFVTSVLTGQGDWFEKELEFWRSWLQPGAIVFDVGANVGIYTFSAAKRIGPEGMAIAVEPSPQCIRCMEATIRRNQFDRVKIYAGAASDRSGTVHLYLNDASELNEILSEKQLEESIESDRVTEVKCFTLDSIAECENLKHVDFIKIDAEGHEFPVLQGSKNILQAFRPIILYENIAAGKGGNFPVAEYLQKQEYRLLCYHPFIREIEILEPQKSLPENLNLLAIHTTPPC